MSMDAEAIVERRRLRRRVTVWRVATVVAVIVLIVSLVGRFAIPDEPYVARVAIDGIIVEAFDRESAIRNLADDDNAKALILRINSPGGTTTGAEDLFQAVRHVAAPLPRPRLGRRPRRRFSFRVIRGRG